MVEPSTLIAKDTGPEFRMEEYNRARTISLLSIGDRQMSASCCEATGGFGAKQCDSKLSFCIELLRIAGAMPYSLDAWASRWMQASAAVGRRRIYSGSTPPPRCKEESGGLLGGLRAVTKCYTFTSAANRHCISVVPVRSRRLLN